MKIVAISGSLRAASSNSALVRAIAKLAPPNVEIVIYDGVGDLPHFSPELDGDDPPAPVVALRSLLGTADAVIVCTPEYAHGMPGSLKNALDWTVSSADFDGKPTAVISASPSEMGGDKAHAWLSQTLRVLGARVPDGASLIVPFVRRKLNADGELTDPALAEALRTVVDALVQVQFK